MSLVGSLEDLGLGDILQIVSLSRKSGVLQLRSDGSAGRIVLRDGMICAAMTKASPGSLRDLLLSGSFVSDEEFDRAVDCSQQTGVDLEQALEDTAHLTADRIEVIRKEHVERTVLEMFGWRYGEFSFEIGGAIGERYAELLLTTGVNPQFLAMEAMRLADEEAKREPSASAGEATADADLDDPLREHSTRDDDPVVFSGDGEAATPRQESGSRVAPGLAVARNTAPADEARSGSAARENSGALREPSLTERRGMVVVDCDLDALEWAKESAGELFERVHIFQRAEDGLARIRQYLTRGDAPLVLLSDRSRLAAGETPADFARRLRALSPYMPIVIARHGVGAVREVDGSAADASVQMPEDDVLSTWTRWEERESMGAELRRVLGGQLRTRRRAPARRPDTAAELEGLKEISSRLRDPSVRGEVLNLVLGYAAGVFSRVAIFMVRDDAAEGLAQTGFRGADGLPVPVEGAELALAEVPWFREVLSSREALRAVEGGDENRTLTQLLGSEPASEVFVAPIESGGHVAALLYGDAHPSRGPLGDTSALEVVLHQAGLALERALLERALSER